MPPTFHLAAALCGLHESSDAWTFIRGFAADWATPPTHTDGVSADELDTAEARWGVRLPAAVRQAYQLFGRRADLTSQHGKLFSPDELRRDTDQVLVYGGSDQGVVFYGVPLADPRQDDPATVTYMTMMDKTAESCEPFAERFSVACVDMLLREHMEVGPFTDGRDVEDGEAASLVAGLAPTTYPRYQGAYASSRWYAGEDIIVCMDDDTWVAVCARKAEALDAYRAEHPGGWVNA